MRISFSLHRFLLRTALSSAQVFVWVILYQLEMARSASISHALLDTISVFALSQIFVILASPLAGKLFAKGMVRSMVLALAALATSLVLLGAYATGLVDPWCIIGFGIGMGLYRAFYSTPFALMRKDLSISASLMETVLACVPAISGIYLSRGDVSTVLYIAAAFTVAAIIPLFRFEAYERYEWTYRESFGMLLEPVHRKFVLQGLVRGFEGATLFVVWPLFLFIELMPDFAVLGAVITASILVILALRNMTTRRKPVHTASLSAALVGGAWIGRMTPAGPLAAVIAQAVGGFPQTSVPAVLGSHDVFADGGSFLDEITTLKEISLGLGRLLLALLFAGVMALHGEETAFAASFILAALCAASAEYLGALREETL
jgi:hypothetical protein